MSRLISAHTLIVLLAGTLMAAATVQAQTTRYVDDDAPNDPGPGDPTVSDPNENGTPEHPFDAIQEGIDATDPNDTVLVLDGTYTGTGNKNLDFGGKAITVRSEYGPETCVIDCESDGRGFYFHSGEPDNAVVDGFTIQNGYVDLNSPGLGGGGGVNCTSSSPTIKNCVVVDNVCVPGSGGGIYCWNSSSTIANCTIGGNYITGVGGGVDSSDGSLTILNCLVVGNWTNNDGGGIHCGPGSMTIINCTIAENYAAGWGGGLQVEYGDATIIGCTITGNMAQSGGGIWCSGGAITNCILWDDVPQEIYVRQPANLSVTYSDVQHGWLGEGNIGVDPLFVDPDGPDNNPATWEDNDYRLASGSLCIDAGCNWAVPPDTADLDNDGDTEEITPLDLDSEGRFFDDPNIADAGCGLPPIVDMGAYEFGDTGPQSCFGDFNGDRVVDLSDLATLLANYGHTEVCEDDLDCDGDVDLSDLSALLAVYGTTCG